MGDSRLPILSKNRYQQFVFLLFVFYTIVVYLFDADESRVKLIYVAYFVLILFLILKNGRIRIINETLYFIGFVFFGLISMIWSVNIQTTLVRTRGVFLLVVFLILVTSYLLKTNSSFSLLVALCIGSLALSIYMVVLYGGFSGMLSALNKTSRIGWEFNNVNALGNSVAAGMVAVTGIALFYKKKWLYVFLLPMGMCFIGAGSRTATLSFLIGVAIMFYLFPRTESNKISTFSRILILFLAITIVFQLIKDLPAVRTLLLRIENAFTVLTGGNSFLKEQSVQTRSEYISLGWNQFLKSPLWGNGMGCAGYALYDKYGYVTYLHNNYIEILASGGIIGFILFYTPYYIILRNYIRRIYSGHEKNPILFISFALLISRLIGHMGTVVYYSKIEFLLLAIWISVVHEKDGYKNEQR